jgi:ubiquinone biosynthesis protein
LQSGEAVVVKVLKPDIKKHVERDIVLLELAATLLCLLFKKSHALKPDRLIEEVKGTLRQEIDLRIEVSHASLLRENSVTIPQCYVPKIYAAHCYENWFVMEKIAGVPIDDLEKLRLYGVDLPALARLCIDVFFTQIFRDRLFHADIHPGNIFVDVTQPAKPILQLIDFGIVGALSKQDHRYIAENMMAIVHRDFMKSARLHREAKWIPDYISLESFAIAMAEIFKPILERPIKDNAFGDMLAALIQVGRRFQIDVQPQLLLLQKTLLGIDGICRQLAPEMNLYQVAQPVIERWVKYHRGPRAILREIKEKLPDLCERLRKYL